MQTTKGGNLAMLLLAVMLAGFGIWQFSGVDLSGGERVERDHDEHEHKWSAEAAIEDPETASITAGILARYGGRILEVEREREHSHDYLEIKLSDKEGRRRIIQVDINGHELMDDD